MPHVRVRLADGRDGLVSLPPPAPPPPTPPFLLGSRPASCRQYCSRRLRRVYKAVRFLHGRGRYQKKKLEAETVKDVR